MRVYVADDHPVVRSGLKAVLAAERGLVLVGEESDGKRALAAIRALAPDVAVLDLQMPGLTGIEVAEALRKESSRTAVVLLSMYKDDAGVQAAIDAGVAAYVVKDDAATELVGAIHAASRGEFYISPSVSGSVVRSMRSGQKPVSLSPRERDVLRVLCEGSSTKEIASRLDLSPKTVEGHRAAIMAKLGIHSVAGLVKYAIRQHLTQIDK